jgi:hypothetical protein
MIEKEIAELRRRFRPDKSNITHIRGCYVNEMREVVSEFDQSLALLSEEETERFLAVLKRTLSGTLGKNLMDLAFTTKQVADSDEHRLLMALRNSALQDETAVRTFFQTVIQSLTMEGNYLILLTYDSYDVPYRAKDGERFDDASSEVFHYVLCSICPVKETKPALSYYVRENQFRTRAIDWLVSPPELGFLFPAFDERSTNLYNALYYSKSAEDIHSEFVDGVFHCQAPMPAAAQKETFQELLGDSLDDECCLEVVQTIHTELCALIDEHKANKVEEPLEIGKSTVKAMLSTCGVGEEHVSAFEEQFDDAFGEDAVLSPRNLVERKLTVTTSDVTIQINPDRSDLLETRVLNGVKYILIRADDEVAVNGVPICIQE